MIPAHAVPWPKSSACGDVSTSISSSPSSTIAAYSIAAADGRVVGVDAAVDHGDLDALRRCCRPRPTRA